MLALFKTWTLYLAGGIEAIAALLIGLACTESTFRSLATFVHVPMLELKSSVRLGKSIRLQSRKMPLNSIFLSSFVAIIEMIGALFVVVHCLWALALLISSRLACA